MELRQYAAIVWKWLWLIVLGVVLATGASWYASRDLPPVYQTTTTLMVGPGLQNPNPDSLSFYMSQQLAQTYSQLIRREPVLRKSAEALGWNPDDWRRLQGMIATNVVAGTQLLEIRVSDNDPERAAVVANTVAQQLQSQIEAAQTEGKDQAFIFQQVEDLQAKIEGAQAEVEKLEASLSQSFSAREIQDTRSQINALQQQINTWQANYASYQTLLGRGAVNAVSIIEAAVVPTTPVGPNKMMSVVLAAVIGLGLTVGVAFLIEYLDDTVKSPEDVERATGLTTIGAISRIQGETVADKLVAAHYPKSPISEAYRVMRTNLQFASVDQPIRSLLITSPNPGEGKSTTMANLGVVLAQSGKRVVLVDTDLRRPIQHKVFGLPNKHGLTTALLGDDLALDGHLQPTSVPGLRVLTTGPLPPNPSELLGSARMGQLIEALGQQADVVLYDTPPALPVTDAAVLASQTDGVLVVMHAGRTRRGLAGAAVENLKQVGGNLLGVALNRLMPGRGGYYYYYYYYYYLTDGSGRRRHRSMRWYQRLPVIGGFFRRRR
jgi:succinoglycan biosynthesis transport protein ExoP